MKGGQRVRPSTVRTKLIGSLKQRKTLQLSWWVLSFMVQGYAGYRYRHTDSSATERLLGSWNTSVWFVRSMAILRRLCNTSSCARFVFVYVTSSRLDRVSGSNWSCIIFKRWHRKCVCHGLSNWSWTPPCVSLYYRWSIGLRTKFPHFFFETPTWSRIFVYERLSHRRSDVLFRLSAAEASGRTIKVVLLTKHHYVQNDFNRLPDLREVS